MVSEVCGILVPFLKADMVSFREMRRVHVMRLFDVDDVVPQGYPPSFEVRLPSSENCNPQLSALKLYLQPDEAVVADLRYWDRLAVKILLEALVTRRLGFAALSLPQPEQLSLPFGLHWDGIYLHR